MKINMSRRLFVQGTTSAGIIASFSLPRSLSAQMTSDYAAVRARWRRYLTAAGVGLSPNVAPYSTYIAGLNAEVAPYISTLNFNNEELFADPLVNNINDYGKTTRVIVGRLRMMALAYAINGTAYYGNTTLRDNIIRALGYVSKKRYYKDQKFATQYSSTPNIDGPATFSGNQYMWEIGLPQPLLDTLIILESEIRAKAAGQIPDTTVSGAQLITDLMAAVLYHNPDVTVYSGHPAGGANLGWNGQIYVLVGMLTESATTTDKGLTALKNAFKDVSTKDGFYVDGSFVQHGTFAYTGGYGLALLDTATSSINLLTGSPWALDSTSVAKVTQWVTRSFDPLVYRGGLMSMVKGRSVARSYEQEGISGVTAAASVVVLSQVAPAGVTLRSIAKGWLQADTSNAFYTYVIGSTATLYTWYLRETIVNPVTAAPTLQGNFQYPLMDRVVHRRPAFSLGLALTSTKISNYESIGAENLRGWYQGSGTTYLYTGTASQYRDVYWPTVDPYRMPGTTVDNRILSAEQAQDTPTLSISGGAGYDGSGVAGMAFGAYRYLDGNNKPAEELRAFKSWFMFGDYILCAGAGIVDISSNKVETIIENRNIGETGANTVTVNDVLKLVEIGTVDRNQLTAGAISFNRAVNKIEQIANADAGYTTWIHVDGFGGYIIPDGNSKLYGVKEKRTGGWRDICNNSGNDPTISNRRYVTLWLDHGVSPQLTGNDSYSYILAPTSGSASATKALAAAPPITLRTNTTSVQYATAKFGTTYVSGALFWEDLGLRSTFTDPFITSNRRSCVFVREVPGRVEVAISDPTETSTTPINIIIRLATTGLVSADPGLTVVRDTTTFRVTLDPTGTKGQSRVAILTT